MIQRIGRVLRRIGHVLAVARASLERPQWIKRPPSLGGRRVCVLATWSPDGSVGSHTLHLAHAWNASGFAVVLMIACDDRRPARWDPAWDPFIAGAAVRRNTGYDFGSWAAALRDVPSLVDATLLALANDSVFGPLRSFGSMLARVDASTADVVGMTDSHQHVHHIQSYLVFYRPSAIRSAAFARFWHRRFVGGREAIIASAELALLAQLTAADLKIEVLFPTEASPTLNPTLVNWRELIDAGYPFVKVQLLRDNPFEADITGWESVLQCNGLDPAIVERHLGRAFPASAAAHVAALR